MTKTPLSIATLAALAVFVVSQPALADSSNKGLQSDTPQAGAPGAGIPEAGSLGTGVPDRIMGRPDAPVTIDLYASFVCVDCAGWHQAVLPLLKNRYIDTGQARLVFHDIAVAPVLPSARAALIGLCAAPEQFFAVMDSFMNGLPALRAGGNGQDWYDAAISATGRDKAEIEACMADEATYNLLLAQNSDPAVAEFARFPGVMVNGIVVEDPTFDAITAAMPAVAAP